MIRHPDAQGPNNWVILLQQRNKIIKYIKKIKKFYNRKVSNTVEILVSTLLFNLQKSRRFRNNNYNINLVALQRDEIIKYIKKNNIINNYNF